MHDLLKRVGSCSALVLLAAGAGASTRDPIQRNASGLPVRYQDGTRVSYTQAELGALREPTQPSARESANAAASVSAGVRTWSFAAWGQGIGLCGIATLPTAQGTEILLGGGSITFGGNQYWYAARWNAASQSYEQQWVSKFYDYAVVALQVGNVLPAPGLEIVLLDANGDVYVYSGADKQLLGTFHSGGAQALRLCELDFDFEFEILTCSASAVYAHQGDGTLAWQRAGLGGSDLVAGQLDADASLEVATTDGRVLDVDSDTIQCTWPNGFGSFLQALDFDADGMQELVYGDAWSFVWAFDVDTCLPKWSIPNANTGAILVSDGDGDGTAELIVGDAQWGDVHAFDLATQAPKWSIANPEHGVTNVAVADVDGDGQIEVLWGAGASSTGADRLYVGSPLTQTIEWENVQLDGPFVGPVRGDLDGDGAQEIVFASESSDAGYGAPRIVVVDGATLALRGISQETSNGLGWEGVGQVRLRDVDADGRDEILLATCTTYDGLIEIYDFQANGTFTKIWDNDTLPFGAVFRTVDAVDLDGNGTLEVLGGVAAAHTGSIGTHVYVYDYASGDEVGHTLHAGGGTFSAITGMEVADFDGDGALEFAALVPSFGLWIFDGATRAPEAFVSGANMQRLSTWQRLPSEPPALLVARADGTLTVHRYVGGGYVQVLTHPIGGAVDGFALGRAQSLALGLQGRVVLRRPLGTVQWQSEPLGPGTGRGFHFQQQHARLFAAATWGVFAFQLY